MLKKGIIQFIPLIVIAAVVGIGSVGVAGVVRSNTISTSGVLASSSSQGSENSKANKPDNSGKSTKNTGFQATDTSSGQGKKPEVSSQDKSNPGVGGPSKQDSKKIDSTEVETSGVDENVENEDEDEDSQEATPTVKPGQKIRTNFPITVNPETNEKTVTTPGGVKTIILPEVAIQNMIKAGFPVVLPPGDDGEATPSATPEGTPSGSTESGELEVDSESEILLTELDGELVYEIPAVKAEKFLGVFDVKVKVKGIVSAQDGQIIKLKKSLFDSILDFLSI